MRARPGSAAQPALHGRRLVCLGALLFAAAAGMSGAVRAAMPASWSAETVAVRAAGGAEAGRIALALRAPEFPRHLLIVPSAQARPRVAAGTSLGEPDVASPWTASAAALAERGIGVAFADAPGDAEGATPELRAPAELRADLEAIAARLGKRYPGVPVHLALHGGAAAPYLGVAGRIAGLGRVLIAAGAFLDARGSDWSALGKPVLLVHAPSSTCDEAPFLEAQQVARTSRFALVVAGYEKHAELPDCGRTSQHALFGLEAELAAAAASWLDGASPPAAIGFAQAAVAFREQVSEYTLPGTFGRIRLEMTLFLPQGEGPFPTVVFNHGDFGIGSPHVRAKRRYREPIVAAELLRLGFAVALPARRGIGMSEGGYAARFLINDADPTYKARVHAADIAAAIEHLRTRAEIDASRLILAGHSAGGFAITYLAGTNPPGVIGAINFSGGRTDAPQGGAASEWNRMMIRGFEQIGARSRVPTLLVFAANDPLYSAATIRAAHAAFVQAGGSATLFLNAPIDGDGHRLLDRPEHWRAPVAAFLRAIAPQAAPAAAGAPRLRAP